MEDNIMFGLVFAVAFTCGIVVMGLADRYMDNLRKKWGLGEYRQEEVPMVKDYDPELEALLDEEMWDKVEQSYSNRSFTVGVEGSNHRVRVISFDKTRGTVTVVPNEGRYQVSTTISIRDVRS